MGDYKEDIKELGKFPKFKPNENLKFIVGDLFQAKQELVRYELGEIASINNLLAGSYLKMKNFHEEQIESSFYEENEYESEKSTKVSQSSQQMMSEVSKSKLNKSNSFSAGGEVSGSYGTVKASAYADFNNNQSKQQSKETAKEFASQIVNESEEKVRERKLTQAYTRNLEIIRKEEEYGFDNRGGGHVVGIKCFVNEIHKVTLINHNKHLFSTIMLAHPSEAYKWFLDKSNTDSTNENEKEPIKPLKIPKTLIPKETVKTVNGLNEQEYIKLENSIPLKLEYLDRNIWQKLAFHFGVASEDLPLPPEEKVSLFESLDLGTDPGKNINDVGVIKLNIPESYIPEHILISNNALTDGGDLNYKFHFSNGVITQVKGNHEVNDLGSWDIKVSSLIGNTDNYQLAIASQGFYNQVILCKIDCILSESSYKTWQLDFYNALKNAQKSNEEESPMTFLENLGVGKVDFKNNPTLANIFIKNELQRCVLQQVFGTDLNGFSVLDRKTIEKLEYPNCDLKKLSKLSPLLTYLNSVFDFDKMTYRFLANYLGAKWNREEIYSDTPVGPLKDFMEASFAEMILPVARGMEHRFRYFMLTNGLVFEGEDVPVIDDEISLSILDELNDDPSLLNEESTIVDESFIKLPSPHIMLQQNAVLPVYSDKDSTKIKLPKPAESIKPEKGEGDAE